MIDKVTMTEAAREARNAYQRRWAKENPEKIKAAHARYWEKKAEQAEKEGNSDGNTKTATR